MRSNIINITASNIIVQHSPRPTTAASRRTSRWRRAGPRGARCTPPRTVAPRAA